GRCRRPGARARVPAAGGPRAFLREPRRARCPAGDSRVRGAHAVRSGARPRLVRARSRGRNTRPRSVAEGGAAVRARGPRDPGAHRGHRLRRLHAAPDAAANRSAAARGPGGPRPMTATAAPLRVAVFGAGAMGATHAAAWAALGDAE